MSDTHPTLPPPPKGRLGIALGAGAAKGWAHIGVLRVLMEAGWVPEVVAGTSIGAAVGAALAAGRLDALEEWARSLGWREVMGYFDLGGNGGLIRAQKVLDDFIALLPDADIESLERPYAAVATDLATGREIWLSEGSVYRAVRSSIAIPGLVEPIEVDGQWLVDGGLVNPVPVSLCRALGADYVVAVDLQTTLLSRRLLDTEHTNVESTGGSEGAPEASDGAPGYGGDGDPEPSLWERMRKKAREVSGEAEEPEKPRVYDVVSNSLNIMQARIGRSRLVGDPPELFIAPRLPEVGLVEFHRAEACIEEGRRAARRSLLVHADVPLGPG